MIAAVLVVGVVEAVVRGDWALARWRAREAVFSRVSALYDDGHDVVIPVAESSSDASPTPAEHEPINEHRRAAQRARSRCVDLEQAVSWCRGRIRVLERPDDGCPF